MDETSKRELMIKYEQDLMEYNKWKKKIPSIDFPDDVKVRIIPPMGGAMVRFVVTYKDENKKGHVSVYLDCHDNLGLYGSPYWEAYPTFIGDHEPDTFRCDMDKVGDLIAVIRHSLHFQNEIIV